MRLLILFAVLAGLLLYIMTRGSAGADSPAHGDINCDGIVSAVDALQILRHVAELPTDTCIALGPLTTPEATPGVIYRP